MVDAISTALSGLKTATQKVDTAARNIAQNPENDTRENGGIIQDIVDLKVGEVQFKANIATLKTAENLTDELLRLFDEEI